MVHLSFIRRAGAGALLATLLLTAEALAGPLGRDRDPLVLAGSSLSLLLGTPPERIVAYRYDAGWARIPVQVDERAVVDFGTIYGGSLSGFTVLTYTDTSTFTGPDPDPAFDADDELALMSKDAGAARAPAPGPPGTIAGSGMELAISDPLGGGTAYTYLFVSDGSLGPWPGPNPVDYDFRLLIGPYKTSYNTSSGPNPEDSRVTTASYAVHFSDRWIRNETLVTAGGASGVDILDRHKGLFAPGNCGRSENTFSAGEGAFIVNREGPVRTLRGYVGANSGPTTYRIHRLYEAREDILTALRVHAISGIMDFFDYSPAATGMVYSNDVNLAGVMIDGVPDAVASGPIGWEMVTGPQGTLVMTGLLNTDIPGFTSTSYYLDDATPPVTQCTGDPYAYGSSGLWVQNAIPNTDPALGAYYILEGTRVIAYDAPGKDAAFASARADEARSPLTAQATPYPPTVSVAGPLPRGLELRVLAQPARGRLHLAFALPEAGRFALALFDPAGRRVATLADGEWSAGWHELTRDVRGLAPGVYWAQGTPAGRSARTVPIVIAR